MRSGTGSGACAAGDSDCGENVKQPTWSNAASRTNASSSVNSSSVSPGKPTMNVVRMAMSGITSRSIASISRTIRMLLGRRMRRSTPSDACCSGMSM